MNRLHIILPIGRDWERERERKEFDITPYSIRTYVIYNTYIYHSTKEKYPPIENLIE